MNCRALPGGGQAPLAPASDQGQAADDAGDELLGCLPDVELQGLVRRLDASVERRICERLAQGASFAEGYRILDRAIHAAVLELVW